MNLTREKELMKRWALGNKSEKVFRERDTDVDSYFADAAPVYIMEYGFESAPELEQAFCDIWRRQQSNMAPKILAISAIKNMPENESADPVQTDSKIPHYIYTF